MSGFLTILPSTSARLIFINNNIHVVGVDIQADNSISGNAKDINIAYPNQTCKGEARCFAIRLIQASIITCLNVNVFGTIQTQLLLCFYIRAGDVDILFGGF
jgi:hypothetical protein